MNKKWALFFSGQGSNLNAVLTKFHKTWTTPPVLVTNNENAGGVKVAENFGLKPLVLNLSSRKKVGDISSGSEPNPSGTSERAAHDIGNKNLDEYQRLHSLLRIEKVDFIFLLGFLKIIPAEFLVPWEGRIFNLHPSLLPQYPGLKSIERAYAEKQDIGVSIHRVTAGVDEGEILAQNLVLKAKDYDPLSLDEVKALVHSKEHDMVCDFILQGETHLGSKI